MNTKNVILIFIATLTLILMVQNTEQVTMRFLFWTVSMSRIVFIPMLFGVGFVTGYIMATVSRRKKKPKPGAGQTGRAGYQPSPEDRGRAERDKSGGENP